MFPVIKRQILGVGKIIKKTLRQEKPFLLVHLNKTIDKVKTLFIDLETSPLISYTWGVWQQDVIQVKKDWYIMCFAYKWAGGKTKSVHFYQDRKDRKLVEVLWKLFDEADVIVAHNTNFDIKKSNARFLIHGLDPPSPYQQIDTLKLARRYFKFDSNKLDELGRQLKVGRKVAHTGKDLWFKCMAGDPKAWKLMIKYNKGDVDLLERIYLKLLPWIKGSIVKEYYKCEACGGRLIKRGSQRSINFIRQRYQCSQCGGWSVGKKI